MYNPQVIGTPTHSHAAMTPGDMPPKPTDDPPPPRFRQKNHAAKPIIARASSHATAWLGRVSFLQDVENLADLRLYFGLTITVSS